VSKIQEISSRFFSSLSRLNCVSIQYKDNGDYEFSCVQFERTKSTFTVAKPFVVYNSKEEFQANIDTKIPIALYIEGKGIISRFSKGDYVSRTDLLSRYSDFDEKTFVRNISFTNGGAIVSFARKTLVEDVLLSFKAGAKIVSLSLGAEIYKLAPNYLSQENNALPYWNVLIENNTMQAIEKASVFNSDQSVLLNGEAVQAKQLYAYFLALECFQLAYLAQKDENYIYPHKQNVYFRQLAQKIGVFSIAFLLVILLVNTFVFNSYYSLNKELQYKGNENKQLLSQLQEMQTDYDKIKDLLIGVNIGKASGYAYFFDRIGYTIPQEISLTKAECTPLLKELKADKKIEFRANTLVIQGIAMDVSSLYNWIDVLKKEQWVKAATLLDYSKDAKSKGAVFIIQIQI